MCGTPARGRRLSTISAGVLVTGRIIPAIPGRVVVPAPRVLQCFVEVFRINLRLLKRFPAHPVREREFHGFPDVVAGDCGPPIKRGDRLGRADDGDIGAVGPDPEPDACLRHRMQEGIVSRDRRQQRPRIDDLLAQFLLLRVVCLPALAGIALERLGGPDDRHTLSGVHDPLHGHLEPEPVQQLRPQFSLLRVHGADQDEPGRMGKGYAFALHHVDAHSSSIEEDVSHVVIEQVDLVDVEDAAVDRGKDTGIDRHRPLTDRPLHVDGAHHPIFGRPEREVDNADSPPFHIQVLSAGLLPGAGAADASVAGRIATVRAAPDHVDLGEDAGKRPDRGGLGRPFLAADEDAADSGVDSVENECTFHRLLADDGGEREDVPLRLV